jgi:hypothetical protein
MNKKIKSQGYSTFASESYDKKEQGYLSFPSPQKKQLNAVSLAIYGKRYIFGVFYLLKY